MRKQVFAAHALPESCFAGAACTALIGVNTLFGLGIFAGVGALIISALGKHGRRDVSIALTFTLMLGLGMLLLSFSTEYASEIYTLLFGEILGISRSEVVPSLLLVLASLIAIVLLYRPLLFSSAMPDVGEAQGVRSHRMDIAFLLLVALLTTSSVLVVGALLVFSLMIAPAAASRHLTSNPVKALFLSSSLALTIIWVSLSVSFESGWPIGFFVGILGAGVYTTARCWAAWRHRQRVVGGRLEITV
jgi:zinc/manganese transport system permease protein